MTMFPDKHYAHCAHCGEHQGMGLASEHGRGFVLCFCGARGPTVNRSEFVDSAGKFDLNGFDSATRRAWNTRAGSDGRAELEAKLVDVANRMDVHIEAYEEPPAGMFKEREMWLSYFVVQPAEGSHTPLAPSWHADVAMKTLPRGWYWAAFPGDWVWYCPERHMARGIDHGDTNWHDLQSERYWGPWERPTTAV